MKRFKLIIAGLLALAVVLMPMWPAFAEGNLLANASVETATNNQPANWHGDHWGNNQATLSYAAQGHEGSKSLRIDMTKYTDGDAKWMADAVAVSGNTPYSYSSYYKANTETEIDLQYTHADGSVSYDFVEILPASTEWQQMQAEFTTPANATKVVVMHVLSKVGWLQTDEFNLSKKTIAAPTDQDNLIGNPSFEELSGAAPASWSQNAWGGTTAQFIHENTGHTGGRSATVKVTAHTDGDAKWYARPVTVQSGKTYVYRDYYKSTANSHVVAAFIDSSESYTYVDLPDAPASSDWLQYQTSVAVPANAVKVTVFHLLDTVGTLTIDDVVLQAGVPQGDNPVIPNSSFENASNATTPTNWQKSSWGANTAKFDYLSQGRTGNKSVKVTVSNYQDGDAKWYFDPITTLKGDQQYRFTAWYKGSVMPQVVAMFLKADGTESYSGMPQPTALSATEWQQYSNTFTVPSDVVAVSAFMFVNQNGWVQTDDYSISDYHPQGFSRPLLSLTFDDGHEDNVNTALPLLTQYGFKSTQCYATTFIEGNAQAVADVRKFQNAGHEICSHTVTHPFMTTLNATDMKYELQHARQYLESITGKPVDNFATPYGDYNLTVNNAIKQYYGSHRTVDEGFNSKDNFDKYRLRVQNILDTTTPEQVAEWIAQAQADNTWLVLVYHRVADDAGPYDAYTSVFKKHLEAVKKSGITVETLDAALDETMAQL